MIEKMSAKVARFEIPLLLLKKWIPNSFFLDRFPNKNRIVKGLSIDSRAVEKNFIYLSIKGKTYDGHLFLKEVKKNKAIAAIVEKNKINKELLEMIDHDFFLLSVDNVIEAFGKLAERVRKAWEGKLITVTGSNGKTTAKEIISAILKIEVGAKSQFSSYGNQNNHIGVPLNLMRLNVQNKFAVIEMGMNQMGEIKKLSSMAQPNFSLIVNAHREHQEFLGSIRATAEENGSVISHLIENNIVIFPKDKKNEDVWWKLANKNKSAVFRFSMFDDESEFADMDDVKEVTCKILGNNPLFIELALNGDSIGRVQLNGLGEHFARTVTGAVAASIALGLSHESILQGLKTFTPIKGRGLFHHLRNGAVVVDDSYNANPDSVHAAITTMANITGRKAMVLGDMAEIGENSESIHREILVLALEHLDEVFLIGKYFSMASKSLKQGKSYSSEKKLEEDVRSWLNLTSSQKSSSLLWIKGSRASNLDLIVNCLVSP